ncbi:MAG TPA: hypothetical protein VLF93_04065 [Candidatus Saccharimonadales bacterium]|nr:hypothetical protein [Candidatus Saccharimonadales bacterium]
MIIIDISHKANRLGRITTVTIVDMFGFLWTITIIESKFGGIVMSTIRDLLFGTTVSSDIEVFMTKNQPQSTSRPTSDFAAPENGPAEQV